MRPPDIILIALHTLLFAVYLQHPYSVVAVTFATSMTAPPPGNTDSGGGVGLCSSGEEHEEHKGGNSSRKPTAKRGQQKVKKDLEEGGCFLCGEPGDLKGGLNGHLFDHQCHLAVRRHRRLLPDAESRLADDKLMASNPYAWRREVTEVDPGNGGRYASRGALASRRAKHAKETFKEEAHEGGVLLLSKRRYKSHVGFWDKVGSETASEDFDRQLDDASTDNEDADGQVRIRVAKVEEVTWKQGRRDITRRGDGNASPRRRRRSRSRRRGSSHGDAGAAGGRGRRRVTDNGTRVPSRSPRDNINETEEPHEFASDGDSVRTGRQRPNARGAGRAVAGRGGRSKSSNDPGRPSIRQKHKTSQEDNPRTFFLTAKETLEKQIDKIVHFESLKSSVRGQLKALMAKLSPEQVQELSKTGETQSVLTNVDGLIDKMKACKEDLKTCDAKSIEPITQKFGNLATQLEEQTIEAEKLLDAANFVKHRESMVKRLTGMKERYQKTKVFKLIKAGHFGQGFANIIAESIHSGQYVEPAKEIDPKQVQLYTAAEVGGKNFPELVKGYQANCAVEVSERIGQLSEELLGHIRKRTIQAKLEHKNTVDPASWLGTTSENLHTDPGGGGWLVGVKSNLSTLGPQFFPLPTIGQFISYVTPSSEPAEGSAFLITLPISRFVDSGVVALGDLASFLETDTGKDLARKTLQVVEMKDDNVAWIPHGTLVQVLYLLDSKSIKCGFFFSLPVFAKSLGQAVTAKTRGPALAWNEEFLQKHSGQPVFQQRLDTMKKFRAACEDTA